LDGVLGLGDRAQHPVGDASQVRSPAFELVGQPFPARHRMSLDVVLKGDARVAVPSIADR
jgi:hypothetical protein